MSSTGLKCTRLFTILAILLMTEGVSQADENVASSAQMIQLGAQVIEKHGCTRCHIIGGKGGTALQGPILDNIGNLLTPEQIRKKVLDPAYLMAEGFENEYNSGIMPDTFSEQIPQGELEALVTYLSTLKNPSAGTPKPIIKGD